MQRVLRAREFRAVQLPTRGDLRAVHSGSADGPLQMYRDLVQAGSITADEQQLHTLQSFDRLYRELIAYQAPPIVSTWNTRTGLKQEKKGFFDSFFGSSEPVPKAVVAASAVNSPTPNGIYLYGGPGCGKTFMMDVFYESLPLQRKCRVHFNDFMIDTHKKLHQLKKNDKTTDYILEGLTNDLIKSAYVLCFDEFQVTDIADAMLLKSMFTLLFNKGIVVVATSNRAPIELYQDGLQRDLFLPFCHLLERQTEVIRMKEARDYRMIKHETQEKKNVYFISSGRDAAFEASFQRHTAERQIFSASLTVYGHKLNLPHIAVHPFRDYVATEKNDQADADRVDHSGNANIARFSFGQLCDENIGAADYIAISQLFDIVFLDKVPQLTTDSRNQIRRFITLIDALYEARVIVVVQATTAANLILDVSKETKRSSLLDELFSFDRCVSRLLEMQSEEYINGCAKFREANIRKMNTVSSADKSDGAKAELMKQRNKEALLHYGAEASLSLQDVSSYYSPWDLQSRQLQLKVPAKQLLLDVWREVQAEVDDCGRSGIISPVPPGLPCSHAEDNLTVCINQSLDHADAHGLARLPLSHVDTVLERIVSKQTGVDSFKPAKNSLEELNYLLRSYDLVMESHKVVGSNHKYHFRKRGHTEQEIAGHFGSFSFNAFVAAIHKHPIITLL